MTVPSPFPRSGGYPDWVQALCVGGNALGSLEALADRLSLQPGNRVLDLGCGRGASSLFLAREFGVQVWAVDIAFDLGEKQAAFEQFGVADRCFALRADARALPFAPGFFDHVVCINSYGYFGTDDKYLPYLAQFVAAGGYLALADIGFAEEPTDPSALPPPLATDYPTWWAHVHSPAWWRHHLGKQQLFRVVHSGPAAHQTALRHAYLKWPYGPSPDAFAQALAAPRADQALVFWELVAERTALPPRLETYLPTP
ncbi:MAG: methyltransferase domain-containing protein [Bacteroidia bacterium]|nr:methyltransferase domain-containing protein [Bacteroidia bacterium]